MTDVAYALPGGWTLFEGVSFKVPEGEHAALVGANGIGKSTLLRLIVGQEPPTEGAIRIDGRVGLMRQFIGSDARADDRSRLPPRLRRAADRGGGRAGEQGGAVDARPSRGGRADAYAEALSHWGDAGGYEAEVLFDECTHVAFGQGYPECAERRIETLSGGERKRLALEVIFRSPFDVILLDEPDNTLDIAGKRWLEDTIVASPKTILMVSHDRAVLDRTATRVITLEGKATWTHPGPFATYAQAREDRLDRIDQQHRRYDEERRRLDRDGEGDEAQVRLQRQLGLEGSQRRAPARAVRGRQRPAAQGRGPGRPDADRRRPDRQDRVPRERARDRRHRASRSTPRSGSASGSA